MKNIFVLLFLIVFISYTESKTKIKKLAKCPKNESYIMAYYGDGGCFKAATLLKKPKMMCRCDEHYVRNVDGRCIKEKDCPACGRNEIYVLSTSTNPTCLEPSRPEKPTPACRCKKGYVRWDYKCIPKKECPRCDKDNEHLIFAGKQDDTCEGPGRTIDPLFACRCYGNFVRKDGKCIPIEECPTDCPENEEFVHAEKEDDTCKWEGSHMEIPWDCCRCIEGYVRDANKTCIPYDECPHEDDCE